MAQKYDEALEAFKQVRTPTFGHHAEMAACYAELGSNDKAREHAENVLSLNPDFTIADHVQGLPFKEGRDRDRYRDGLRKAELPDL